MFARVILGSGLVGMIAREILGADWTIIPHGMSRYYSYSPPLADNYIQVSDAVREIMRTPRTKVVRRAFSIGEHLHWIPHQWVLDLWTEKVYGEPHEYFHRLFGTELEVFEMGCDSLYRTLLARHTDEVRTNNQRYGEVCSIGGGEIRTSTGVVVPYSRIVSTIPLDVLIRAIEKDMMPLEASDMWIYMVATDQLDFEGADEVFVTDKIFDFYKVSVLGPSNYLFFCNAEIRDPVAYFGAFTNNRLQVPMERRTQVHNAIPRGQVPNLKWLENEFSIRCIGSNAEWDDMVDIGSCIGRILKLPR